MDTIPLPSFGGGGSGDEEDNTNAISDEENGGIDESEDGDKDMVKVINVSIN